MSIERKTTMDFINSTSIPVHDHPIRNSVLKVGRFILHFLEMTLAMMVGMPILFMLRNLVPTSSPYAAALKTGTVPFDLVMTIFMVAPMVAWMIVRRHGLRHSVEMAIGMSAPVAAIDALRLLGAGAYLPWLSKASHLAMFLGMLAVMLYRCDHSTGNAGHMHSAGDHSSIKPGQLRPTNRR